MSVRRNSIFKDPVNEAVTGTAASVMDKNAGRDALTIQNTGAGDLYVGFSDSLTTSAYWIVIPGGENYIVEPSNVPSNEIWCVSNATTSVAMTESGG